MSSRDRSASSLSGSLRSARSTHWLASSSRREAEVPRLPLRAAHEPLPPSLGLAAHLSLACSARSRARATSTTGMYFTWKRGWNRLCVGRRPCSVLTLGSPRTRSNGVKRNPRLPSDVNLSGCSCSCGALLAGGPRTAGSEPHSFRSAPRPPCPTRTSARHRAGHRNGWQQVGPRDHAPPHPECNPSRSQAGLPARRPRARRHQSVPPRPARVRTSWLQRANERIAHPPAPPPRARRRLRRGRLQSAGSAAAPPERRSDLTQPAMDSRPARTRSSSTWSEDSAPAATALASSTAGDEAAGHGWRAARMHTHLRRASTSAAAP